MIRKKICKIDKIEKNNFFKIWIEDFKDEIIVYKYKKKIYVKSSICPHFGGPISYKNDKYLFCYWHGLKFSTENGQCLNQKSFKTCLIDYLYEVKKDYIYVFKK